MIWLIASPHFVKIQKVAIVLLNRTTKPSSQPQVSSQIQNQTEIVVTIWFFRDNQGPKKPKAHELIVKAMEIILLLHLNKKTLNCYFRGDDRKNKDNIDRNEDWIAKTVRSASSERSEAWAMDRIREHAGIAQTKVRYSNSLDLPRNLAHKNLRWKVMLLLSLSNQCRSKPIS